jgi:hypothetical protein
MKAFCEKHDMQMQDLHELALAYYIEHVGAHNPNVGAHNSDVWAPHDDLMIFKTLDDIIMLYRRLTNRKWTAADDRAGYKYNNIDRRLIEIGMIHTYLNERGKKINSFAYFIPEIDLMINLQVDISYLDVYLRARREMLAKWMQKQEKPAKSGKQRSGTQA